MAHRVTCIIYKNHSHSSSSSQCDCIPHLHIEYILYSAHINSKTKSENLLFLELLVNDDTLLPSSTMATMLLQPVNPWIHAGTTLRSLPTSAGSTCPVLSCSQSVGGQSVWVSHTQRKVLYMQEQTWVQNWLEGGLNWGLTWASLHACPVDDYTVHCVLDCMCTTLMLITGIWCVLLILIIAKEFQNSHPALELF